ncbi:hypothetical protein ABWW58_12510 [Sporolactobacillus sp. STCC-11]|uniref:hypothetical protein n=1 Tax=Sporolactobacillus caesalpiniae TaxID=3230362 RepID=UPI00339AEAE1
MKRGDIIELIYQAAGSGKISQRHVRILRVTESYVNAYCYKRGGIRIFRRSGILATHVIRLAS